MERIGRTEEKKERVGCENVAVNEEWERGAKTEWETALVVKENKRDHHKVTKVKVNGEISIDSWMPSTTNVNIPLWRTQTCGIRRGKWKRTKRSMFLLQLFDSWLFSYCLLTADECSVVSWISPFQLISRRLAWQSVNHAKTEQSGDLWCI